DPQTKPPAAPNTRGRLSSLPQWIGSCRLQCPRRARRNRGRVHGRGPSAPGGNQATQGWKVGPLLPSYSPNGTISPSNHGPFAYSKFLSTRPDGSRFSLGRMSKAGNTPEDRARHLVRRLLDAVDRALVAAREVESARAALDKEAQRPRLRAAPLTN